MTDTVGVVGAGALGTLLIARLSAAGFGVCAVSRSTGRRAALAREFPAAALGGDGAVLAGAGLVFLCVKSYDTEAAGRTLAEADLKSAAICSLQNGWGHMDFLAARLPRTPLLAGATSLGAYLDEKGVLHASTEGCTTVAPWRSEDFPSAERAVSLLSRAGLHARTSPDARATLWRKLVLNSAVNPVAALAQRPNGALLDSPPLFRLAEEAAREAARVGSRLGWMEAGFDPAAALRAILAETRENRSSMTEDLAHGRRTEVDEINGAVVRLARGAGEPAPLQEALLTLVRAAEGRRRDPAGDP